MELTTIKMKEIMYRIHKDREGRKKEREPRSKAKGKLMCKEEQKRRASRGQVQLCYQGRCRIGEGRWWLVSHP
jgi:hypothetical protein